MIHDLPHTLVKRSANALGLVRLLVVVVVVVLPAAKGHPAVQKAVC
jgi:hypothetical protein